MRKSSLLEACFRACGADLAGLLREAQQVLDGVAIRGVISDGQHSIRNAVQTVLPDVPHQLCHFRSTHNDFPQQEHGGRTDVGTRADEGRERHKIPLLEHDGSHFQCYTHSCGKHENPSYF